MHTIKDKVFLVTGGANGIGAEVVREILKEHPKYVAIVDINQHKGLELERDLKSIHGNDKIDFYTCDVTNDDQLFDVFQKVIDKNGTIDVVVNGAAIACDEKNMYKKEIEINFTAVVTSTLKALELMRSDEGGKGGTIINVSSIGALGLRSPSLFIYSATKIAVLHLSTCIGKEDYFRHTNVRVLTICFGCTDTKMLYDIQGIDKLSTKKMSGIRSRDGEELQTPQAAAQGLIESFKTGESGSVWLIDNGRTHNFTNNIEEGFNIMCRRTVL